MTLIDNMVLSNFAAVQRLDLLRLRWGTINIAYSVYEELQAGLRLGYHFLANLEGHVFPSNPDGWMHIVGLEGEEELTLYGGLAARLHRGEAMSLAIARHRGWLFLTDDQMARRYADQIGVSVIGTVGVLIQLLKLGIIPLNEANVLLKQMIEKARYHSPVADLSELVTGAQEGKQKGEEDNEE